MRLDRLLFRRWRIADSIAPRVTGLRTLMPCDTVWFTPTSLGREGSHLRVVIVGRPQASADRVVASDVGDVGRGGGGHLAGQFAGRRLDYGYLINTTIVTMAK
jgi:hypothetical protein